MMETEKAVAEVKSSCAARDRLASIRGQIEDARGRLAALKSERSAGEIAIRDRVRQAALAGEPVDSDRSVRLQPIQDRIADGADGLGALEELLPGLERGAAEETCLEVETELRAISGQAVEALARFRDLWARSLEALADVDVLAREHDVLIHGSLMPAWRVVHSDFERRTPADRYQTADQGLQASGAAFGVHVQYLRRTLQNVEFFGAPSKNRARPFEAGEFLHKWKKEDDADGGRD